MDYGKIVKDLIVEVDLTSDLDKRKAFNLCTDYADEHIENFFDYNSFLQEAAAALYQPTRHITTFSKGPLPKDAKLHLNFSDLTGPALTGNKAGLFYLSRSINCLMKSSNEGEHFHLYAGEDPMFGNAYPLTICLEADNWFKKATEKRNDDIKQPDIEKRNINPDEIVAFSVIGELIPEILMRKNKIYKILLLENYFGGAIVRKVIRENKPERVYQFTYCNDEGKNDKIAFDLDDPTVIFYTKQDLEQICLK